MRGTLPRMTTRQWMRVVLLVALALSWYQIRQRVRYRQERAQHHRFLAAVCAASRRSIPTPASPDGSNTTRRWPASTEMSPTFSGSPSRRS